MGISMFLGEVLQEIGAGIGVEWSNKSLGQVRVGLNNV